MHLYGTVQGLLSLSWTNFLRLLFDFFDGALVGDGGKCLDGMCGTFGGGGVKEDGSGWKGIGLGCWEVGLKNADLFFFPIKESGVFCLHARRGFFPRLFSIASTVGYS